MELNNELCAEVISTIEGNETLRDYLMVTSNPRANQLLDLSLKRVLQLETLTNVIIEYSIPLENPAMSKLATLENFLKVHPWIYIEEDEAFHYMLNWLNVYKAVYEVGDGQRFVIHPDGEHEIVDEEEYFKVEVIE